MWQVEVRGAIPGGTSGRLWWWLPATAQSSGVPWGGGWHHPHEVPVTENPVSALPEGGGLERGVAKESVSGLCLQPGYKRRQNHQ